VVPSILLKEAKQAHVTLHRVPVALLQLALFTQYNCKMLRCVIVALTFFHAFSPVVSSNLKQWDFRKQFHPPTMLLISSTQEKKVSYTQLSNFKSNGVVLPILDGSVAAPYGIAWDAGRSVMYVCDGTLKKIFRVKLKAKECVHKACKMPYQLVADGDQLTVVEKVLAQWVTVDHDGNLYFTDKDSKSVNRLDLEYINQIIQGRITPKDLKRITEPVAEGEEAVKESREEGKKGEKPTTKTALTTPMPAHIFQLYENGASKNVGMPAGLAISGPELFWTNEQEGGSKGSVAYGKNHPRVKAPVKGDGRPSFASAKMANVTGSAYGIALTSNKVLYTDLSQNLWATSRGSGKTVALSKALLKPRGIVWDGDNTVFVADQESNKIVSIPVGLLRENAPVTQTLDIHAPFGIALISKDDPVWNPLRAKYGGANRVASVGALVLAVVAMIVVA